MIEGDREVMIEGDMGGYDRGGTWEVMIEGGHGRL